MTDATVQPEAAQSQQDEAPVQQAAALPIAAPSAAVAVTAPTKEQFAVVEIFGHRSHAGRVSQVDFAGGKMLKIEVPIEGAWENGVAEYLYGGGAIFSVRACTRQEAEEANKPWRSSWDPADGDQDEDAADD